MPRVIAQPLEDGAISGCRFWAADVACAIAATLGVDENDVLAVLDEQLEARMAALGWLEDNAHFDESMTSAPLARVVQPGRSACIRRRCHPVVGIGLLEVVLAAHIHELPLAPRIS